jgi:site-specific recombinase XerD
MNIDPAAVHYTLDGVRAASETCRRIAEHLSNDMKAVNCKRCSTLFGTEGAAGQRARVRLGHLTLEQVKKLINSCSSAKERAEVTVAYYLGLRASEVGGIPMTQVDLERNTIDIVRAKGSLSGVYPLAPVRKTLDIWLKQRPVGSRWLFPDDTRPELPLDRRRFYEVMLRAGTRAGFERRLCHPHVLKHSIATHMLARGDDIRHVQEWLGHKRIDSTMVYAEMSGKTRQQGQTVAAELMGEL